MNDAVLLRIEDRVATVTLNRPQVLNALDEAMAKGLADALARIDAGGIEKLPPRTP